MEKNRLSQAYASLSLSLSLCRLSSSSFHQDFSDQQNHPIACHSHVSNPDRTPLFLRFYATRFLEALLTPENLS